MMMDEEYDWMNVKKKKKRWDKFEIGKIEERCIVFNVMVMMLLLLLLGKDKDKLKSNIIESINQSKLFYKKKFLVNP